MPCDLIGPIPRLKTSIIDVNTSPIGEDVGLCVGTVLHSYRAGIIVGASPLLDVPVIIGSRETEVGTPVFKTTLILDGIAHTTRLLLASWIIEKCQVVGVALFLEISVADPGVLDDWRVGESLIIHFIPFTRGAGFGGCDSIIAAVSGVVSHIVQMETFAGLVEYYAVIRVVSSRVPWWVGEQAELCRRTTAEVRSAVLENAVVGDIVIDTSRAIFAVALGEKSAPVL